MSGKILCEKCGSIMSYTRLNQSSRGEATIYNCYKCGYHYESGVRFNKEINQFVKYLRFL